MNKRWYSVTAKVHDKNTGKKSARVYLCNAVNFVDAEGQVTLVLSEDEEVEQDDITAIKREGIEDVYTDKESELWYKVKWRMRAEPGEKKQPAHYDLVKGNTTADAEAKWASCCDMMPDHYEVMSVTLANITEVLLTYAAKDIE